MEIPLGTLIFVIIIAVIALTDDLQSSATIIVIIAAVVAIYVELGFGAGFTPEHDPDDNQFASIPESDETPQIESNLGAEYDVWQTFRQVAPRQQTVIDPTDSTNTSDNRIMNMSTQRGARAKRTIDARSTRGADYDKYFYSDEFDRQSEPWWGASET